MATCRLVTLGCKVNQYETQWVKEALEAGGFREALPDEPADLCFVNTCTVTAQGDAKSRQVIRRLSRQNPGTRILVTGCYATRDPEAVRSLPGVVDVVTDKRELPDALGRFGVVDLPKGISRFDGRHRAFVKVQDGCVLDCSFCIIPQVRPGLRSRPPEQIEAEVCRLVSNGYREIVLTGIHLGHYGVDLSLGKPRRQWCRLWHLLERLCRLALPHPWRIRLSSLEASEVTDDFVHVLGAHAQICPHLHLSLQSGSDRVLARMRRRYRSAGFFARVEKIKQTLDLPAWTTDIIVGFPGETEEDFQQTCWAAREVGFSKIHIFPFSARRNTPAATMPNQIAPEIKQERADRLADLERELAQQYYRSLLGRELEVLAEQPVKETEPAALREKNRAAAVARESLPLRAKQLHSSLLVPSPARITGTACRYVPVSFVADERVLGNLVRVRAVQAAEGHVLGMVSGDDTPRAVALHAGGKAARLPQDEYARPRPDAIMPADFQT